MSDRSKAIVELMDAINADLSEEAMVSFEQVVHYVGSDMSTSEIMKWVYDTRGGHQAVSRDDVLDLEG